VKTEEVANFTVPIIASPARGRYGNGLRVSGYAQPAFAFPLVCGHLCGVNRKSARSNVAFPFSTLRYKIELWRFAFLIQKQAMSSEIAATLNELVAIEKQCLQELQIIHSVLTTPPVGKQSIATATAKRRSQAARRGILEEAIDYFLEHPSIKQADIEKMFHLEQGALSRKEAQHLINNRRPKAYNPKRKWYK
jgi:hypothetical protein